MRVFPLCMDLERKTVLLTGTGQMLIEKIEKLLPFGVHMQVISPDLQMPYAEHPQITHVCRTFIPDDLQIAPAFVVIAGLSADASEPIFTLCRSRNIPVNTVDIPALCSFIFPAMICRGSCTIAVSTDGKSPAAGVYLRDRIAELVPDNMDQILDWAVELRTGLKDRISDAAQRRIVLKKAVAAAIEQNRPLVDAEINKLTEI